MTFFERLEENYNSNIANRLMRDFGFRKSYFVAMLEYADSKLKIENFETPNLDELSPSILHGDVIYFPFIYLPDPQYKFFVSDITEYYYEKEEIYDAGGKNRILSYFPYEDVTVQFSVGTTDEDYVSIYESFREWIDGIIEDINLSKRLNNIKAKKSRLIDLTEDKPFSEGELETLQYHFNNALDSTEEKLLQQNANNKDLILEELNAHRKLLNELYVLAKDQNNSKKKWYETHWLGRKVKWLADKLVTVGISETAKLVWKNVDFNIITHFITQPFDFHLIPVMLDPAYHNVLPTVKEYIQVIIV